MNPWFSLPTKVIEISAPQNAMNLQYCQDLNLLGQLIKSDKKLGAHFKYDEGPAVEPEIHIVKPGRMKPSVYQHIVKPGRMKPSVYQHLLSTLASEMVSNRVIGKISSEKNIVNFLFLL